METAGECSIYTPNEKYDSTLERNRREEVFMADSAVLVITPQTHSISLLAHLEELRKRIIFSVAGILVTRRSMSKTNGVGMASCWNLPCQENILEGWEYCLGREVSHTAGTNHNQNELERKSNEEGRESLIYCGIRGELI